MKHNRFWEKPGYDARSIERNPRITLNHTSSSLEDELLNQGSSTNAGSTGSGFLKRSLHFAMPAIAALYVFVNVACNTQATPTPFPTNTQRPTATATATATPVPRMNVISVDEFRKGLCWFYSDATRAACDGTFGIIEMPGGLENVDCCKGRPYSPIKADITVPSKNVIVKKLLVLYHGKFVNMVMVVFNR